MKKVVVDTSVFIRLFTMDDESKSTKAKELIEKAISGEVEIFVPFIVVAEIVWVLEKIYRVSKEEISEIIESLINTPGMNVELSGVVRSALGFYRGKNIKFADAVISSWTLNIGADELITFDETDFKKVDNLKVKIL